MSLTLYFHPLSSFCQKALIALYENDTPFTPHLVDLGDEASRASFLAVWPVGKFPVLRDAVRDVIVPEATVIVEYLDRFYPGRTRLVPDAADAAWDLHMRDRFFDLYINTTVGKIVTDRLRPDGQHDTFGVVQAKAQLQTALEWVERDMAASPRAKTWAMGDAFTMADCAAAPALFYADLIMPFGGALKNTAAYLDRLKTRPSYARALKEAAPFLKFVPQES
jgi:glutathione S-transferase